jgi:hypothetical protein
LGEKSRLKYFDKNSETFYIEKNCKPKKNLKQNLWKMKSFEGKYFRGGKVLKDFSKQKKQGKRF